MILGQAFRKVENSNENILGGVASEHFRPRSWISSTLFLILAFLSLMSTVAVVESTDGNELEIREQRQTICPGFDIIHRQNRRTLEIHRMLVIRGIEYSGQYDSLYKIDAGYFCGENLFVLMVGNFGEFVARYCKGKGFEYVAGLPSVTESPIWDFSVEQLPNHKFKMNIVFGCISGPSLKKDKCEKKYLELKVLDGGFKHCEGFPAPVSQSPSKTPSAVHRVEETKDESGQNK